MQYENRQPIEGVNVSKEHPLKTFLKFAVSAAILVVALVIVLQFFGGALARLIPLRYEVAAVEKMDFGIGNDAGHPEMVSYLNELAARLIPFLNVPPDVNISVHYDEEDVFNAFATLGGNVLFYRGLLVKMPHENALAMVVAHEIAHVIHRDPIVGLGGGIASSLALSVVVGNSGSAGSMLQTTGALTSMQFTRKMEVSADSLAIHAVQQLYGHVNGADELFKAIAVERDRSDVSPDWLTRFSSTHPLDEDRIDAIAKIAADNEWSLDGELTPLPEAFDDWMDL